MNVPRPQVLVTDGEITQFFDTPVDYIKGRTHHEALDIVTNGSTPLRAVTAGTVTKVIDKFQDIAVLDSEDHNFGNEVWIEHETGIESRSCHMRPGITVKVGDKFASGDQYGWTGRTGYHVPATIYHVHYEEYWQGKRIDPLTSANQLTIEEMEKYDEYIKQTDPRLDDLEAGFGEVSDKLNEIIAQLNQQGLHIEKMTSESRLRFFSRSVFRKQFKKVKKLIGL